MINWIIRKLAEKAAARNIREMATAEQESVIADIRYLCSQDITFANALLIEYVSPEFADALGYVNSHIAAHRIIAGKEQPMILFGWQKPDSVPYRYNVLHLVTGGHVLNPGVSPHAA